MNNLPKRCYTETNGQQTLIINGHMGHYPVKLENNGDKPSSTNALNKMLGVTKEEVDIMVGGSMFGWNTPMVLGYKSV